MFDRSRSVSQTPNYRHTDYSSNTGFKEKPSIQERRMLRISFTQIKDHDMFNLRKKYRNG